MATARNRARRVTYSARNWLDRDRGRDSARESICPRRFRLRRAASPLLRLD